MKKFSIFLATKNKRLKKQFKNAIKIKQMMKIINNQIKRLDISSENNKDN